MTELPATAAGARAALEGAGLGAADVEGWLEAAVAPAAGRPDAALAELAAHASAAESLLERLPPKPRATPEERRAATILHAGLARARAAVLAAHTDDVYARATTAACDGSLSELLARVRETAPGLLPSSAAETRDRRLRLADKEGVEAAHATLVSSLLAAARAGAALVQTLRRPTADARALLPTLQRTDAVDLDRARVRRHGRLGIVELSNPQHLNSEDDATLADFELAVDLVLLDERVAVGVLRGAAVPAGRYAGRRVFSSGLNLTALADGSLSYLFFPARELGVVEKLHRGLDGIDGGDKPWLAAVDTFAIGGGCQLLLVLDGVLAEPGAVLSLPATIEGFIPGAAAYRLPRVVGPRLARRLMLFGGQLRAGSAEAAGLVDEVVAPEAIPARLDSLADRLFASGSTGLAANRRALRLGEESPADFLRYMADYATSQAECMFGAELARNLEEHWVRREREHQASTRGARSGAGVHSRASAVSPC